MRLSRPPKISGLLIMTKRLGTPISTPGREPVPKAFGRPGVRAKRNKQKHKPLITNTQKMTKKQNTTFRNNSQQSYESEKPIKINYE